MNSSKLAILSIFVLSGLAQAERAPDENTRVNTYLSPYQLPGFDVSPWVSMYVDYTYTLDVVNPVIATPAFAIDEIHQIEDLTAIDSSTTAPYVDQSTTVESIDLSIDALCGELTDEETLSPELAEALRLWLLDALSGESETICYMDNDEETYCAPADEDAPPNPLLRATTDDQTVISALPAVKGLVPIRGESLNKNVVPQLFDLLERKNDKIRLRTVEILGLMANKKAFTDANKKTAKTKLEDLKKNNADNKTLVEAIDKALKDF